MFENLQSDIHYAFNDTGLLATAMTHSSWANEQQEHVEHNERLEFLGDAVLELCVSEELFTRFPGAREGDLTRMRARLVSKPALAELARDLKLEQYLRLGRGEESQGGRERSSLLSDALEAMLGAVFLDGGYERARAVVRHVLAARWPCDTDGKRSKDYKSRLQEMTQKVFRERPVYALMGSSGPEHEKRFEVRLTLPDDTVFTAVGPSVKRAEQMAAGLALKALESRSEG
ncbi:ribonuclease III [Nitratidesulfovibrio sp. D1]|uniref:ribonuclease III n=1 Tax=Nitratidesulfovibrio sp. D1 TaxID=3440151 RepID=UPI003EBB88B4